MARVDADDLLEHAADDLTVSLPEDFEDFLE